MLKADKVQNVQISTGIKLMIDKVKGNKAGDTCTFHRHEVTSKCILQSKLYVEQSLRIVFVAIALE
jgi:hypothetical protein